MNIRESNRFLGCAVVLGWSKDLAKGGRLRNLVLVTEAAEAAERHRSIIYDWIKDGQVYSETMSRKSRRGIQVLLLVDLDDVLYYSDLAKRGIVEEDFEFEEWQLRVARKVFGIVED